MATDVQVATSGRVEVVTIGAPSAWRSGMGRPKRPKKAQPSPRTPGQRTHASLTPTEVRGTLHLALACAGLTVVIGGGLIGIWSYARATRWHIHLPFVLFALPMLTAGIGVFALWQWRVGLRRLKAPPGESS